MWGLNNINENLLIEANFCFLSCLQPESSGGEEEDHESSCEGSEELIEQIEAQRVCKS